jgi:lipopolysaccharide transport system ATP-binding protein
LAFMTEIVIKAENIGKKYVIGHQTENGRYVALRDVLMHNARTLWNKTRDLVTGEPIIQGDTLEEVWALEDVNFEICRGEAVGVIGRNGAGKSTLLKILSRITEPSTGKATIKGRVASLLEVGTGFHPELTGRENIYLNGTILGMTRTEIRRKFDEIIAFAEVDKYLDTPVKRYSSGMYVRLAFAVAAHLEPEILVVDEVLAVGDATFQKKCLGKMGEVANEGRTVLFVSHNMAAVEALCSKVMIISKGRNGPLGPTREAVQTYLQEGSSNLGLPLRERKDRKGKGRVRFTDISFLSNSGVKSNVYAIGDDICICLRVENSCSSDVTVRLSLSVNTSHESLISCDSALKGRTYTIPGASESLLICRIISSPLNFGNYDVSVAIFDGHEPEDWIVSAAKFSIESGGFDDRVTSNPFPVLSRFEWSINGQV